MKAVPVSAPGLDVPGGSQERQGGGDSSLRARLAAMEMELEALKRGSDGGGSQVGGAATGELAEALKAQTAAIAEALASGRGGQSSITTVKTDVAWPTLTVFYEEFEDVCALANNCKGMSARELWRSGAGVAVRG